MGYQVQYSTYNPGQYPAEVQENLDRMTAAGWRIHTAMPAYNELYVLWEREAADAAPGPPKKTAPAKRAKEHQPEPAPPEPAPPLGGHFTIEAELSPTGR